MDRQEDLISLSTEPKWSSWDLNPVLMWDDDATGRNS